MFPGRARSVVAVLRIRKLEFRVVDCFGDDCKLKLVLDEFLLTLDLLPLMLFLLVSPVVPRRLPSALLPPQRDVLQLAGSPQTHPAGLQQ